MKTCDYCKKEISYFEQYCCDECERKALSFYSRRDKYTNIFSVVNIIGVFAIPLGLFMSAFARKLGLIVVACAVLLLGIMVTLFPFPVENMITSMKLKKAVGLTRKIGIALFAIGIVCLPLVIIFVK